MKNFTDELLRAENTLNTQYSFDLAEPSYLACLKMIEDNADRSNEFQQILIDLFDSKALSDEPVAYLMHRLRWPAVKSWIQSKYESLDNQAIDGRPFEKILAAFEDEWSNKEFYRHL